MLSAMLAVTMIRSSLCINTQYLNHGKVGLCGHSLGAGMALIVGKHLVISRVCLEIFLFNPPIVLDCLLDGAADGKYMGSNPIGLLAWNMFVLTNKQYLLPNKCKRTSFAMGMSTAMNPETLCKMPAI